MPTFEIPVEDDLLDKLSEAFFWEEFKGWPRHDDGGAALIVARVDGLSIVIFANEHPPPHFHVKYQGKEASFSITNCERLAGVRGLERYDARIRSWWRDNQEKLIELWNNSRPTNCPVGPISTRGAD